MSTPPHPTPIRTAPKERCVACGSPGRPAHVRLRDRLFGVEGTWSLRSCERPGCGVLWLDPCPIEDDLPLIYRNYYTHGDAPASAPAGAIGSALIRIAGWMDSILKRVTGLAASRRRLDLMFLDRCEPGRLLEVGCGDGRRLSRLRDLGWSVMGQEVDERAAEVARSRGLDVRLGHLGGLGLPAGSFDAVVANHVLEHVPDPAGLLRECRELVRPGGRLVITTPNPAGDGRARYGDHWFGLDPPRHLHLFPPQALAGLAERAGFRVVEARGDASRAHAFGTGSASIARHGHFVMGGEPPWDARLAGLLFQYRSRFAAWARPSSGEETILVAVADRAPRS